MSLALFLLSSLLLVLFAGFLVVAAAAAAAAADAPKPQLLPVTVFLPVSVAFLEYVDDVSGAGLLAAAAAAAAAALTVPGAGRGGASSPRACVVSGRMRSGRFLKRRRERKS